MFYKFSFDFDWFGFLDYTFAIIEQHEHSFLVQISHQSMKLFILKIKCSYNYVIILGFFYILSMFYDKENIRARKLFRKILKIVIYV